jgi:peptide deformylase
MKSHPQNRTLISLTVAHFFTTMYAEEIMMLDIVTLGDDILKQRAAVIPTVDEVIDHLARSMLEAMYYGKGIGLAGPQVGELKRLFVCHVPEDKPRVFINPEIIQTSPEQVQFEEGCLSIPGVYADLPRAESIQVQAWDTDGKPFTLEAHGILARVIQHETDHLNGVLFIDHLQEKKRNRVLKNYKRLIKS